MLLGQQRGRAQDRDLLAVGGGDKCRAQCHLGLAETDIAADQPIHRAARNQVLGDRMDGGKLVGCFVETESFGEGFIVLSIESEGMAFSGSTPGIQIEQFGGGIARALGGTLAGLFPLTRSEDMERRFVRRGAGIAADQVKCGHRHIKRCIAGIGQMQEFGGSVAQIEVDQAAIASDAVLGMNHRIANRELRQVADDRIDIGDGLALAAPTASLEGARKQLGFGNDRHRPIACQQKAFRQRADAQSAMGRALGKAAPVVDLRQVDAVIGQQLGKGFAPASRFGNEKDPGIGGIEPGLQARQRHIGAPLDHQRRQRPGMAALVSADRCITVAVMAQRIPAKPPDRDEKRFDVDEELVGSQQRTLRVMRQEVMTLPGLEREASPGGFDIAMGGHDGVGRQVIEEGGGRVKKEREPVLDAGTRNAIADVAIGAGLGGVALEALAPAAAKRSAGRFVERKLAPRQDAHRVDREKAALRVRVEGADGFDFVVEQIKAIGQGRAHRKQIDQAAAHAVFTGPHHLADMLIAGGGELAAQCGFIQTLGFCEGESVAGDKGGRRQAMQGGRGCDDQQVDPALLQFEERRQSFRDQILVRRKGVVGQGFPVRQRFDPQGWCEPPGFFLESRGVQRRGGDHHQQARLLGMASGERRQQQGVCAAVGCGQGNDRAGAWLRDAGSGVGDSEGWRGAQAGGDGVQATTGSKPIIVAFANDAQVSDRRHVRFSARQRGRYRPPETFCNRAGRRRWPASGR